VVRAAGGATERVRAVLTGGYHGTWVDGARAPAVRLDAESLEAAGLRMGAGAIVLLPSSACPVAEVARVVGWLAEQTAGQCGPCVHGLAAIAGQLDAIRTGRADRLAIARLDRWCAQVAGRGACHHPDGTVDFVASALEVFEAEVEMHRRFGPCEQCGGRAVLATPAHARLAA
jgi:NADH:ubiquinone oxidoreductase subunit F (NADH-binding)